MNFRLQSLRFLKIPFKNPSTDRGISSFRYATKLKRNSQENAFQWQENFLQVNCKRAAGNFQRLEVHEHDHFEELRAQYFQKLDNSDTTTTTTSLSHSEWTDLRQKLLERFRYINVNNIDAIVINMCANEGRLSLAKDYIQYLRAGCQLEPNDGAWGRLLRVYNFFHHGQGGRELSPPLQQEIFAICDRILQKYPILEGSLCESLILGLVITERWRECFKLLEMAKITRNPSHLAYSDLAVRCFREKEWELGWSLCDDIIQLQFQPKCEIFLSYLQSISESQDSQCFRDGLRRFLEMLSRNALIITEVVVELLFQIQQKHPDWFQLKRSHLITNNSKRKLMERGASCSNCHQKLQNVGLSDQEFQRLKDTFNEKVLLAGDIFLKSTPREVQEFREYVSGTAPYDCVIDGLNVAYSMGKKQSNSVLANWVVNIVRYFVEQDKKVLVLGRKHMQNWTNRSLQYLRKNAAIFLTDNLSQDDPFLLYAALYSGPSTDFFSRDLMRQHAHLLGTDMKTIFRRWQQEHQYSILKTTGGGVNGFTIKEPIRHVTWPHCLEDGTWHLPYKEQYTMRPADTFETPKDWLCLRI